MTSAPAQHILFLQGSTEFGGSKRSLLGLIELLRGTAFQPLVACPGRGWLTEQLDQLQTPYITVPFYAWRKLLERPRVGSSIRNQWLPALEGRHVALVHSNEFWWAPHAVCISEALNIPSVVHLRDGHHTLQKALQYRLDRVNTVLAVSSELREQFKDHPQLYARTRVLFNGHDERLVHFTGERATVREKFGLAPGTFAIGNAGKLCERKNQRLLLQGVAHLKTKPGMPPFQVLLAGDAEPAYEQLLRNEAQRLGLQNEVQFLGPVAQMNEFYAALDLLVHCARREGLPRVLPEAMLAKTPVVATVAEGVHDAIPDGRFGTVVPNDDVQALGSAIALYLNAPGRVQATVEQACERARSLFTLPAHRDNVLHLYSQLVAARP